MKRLVHSTVVIISYTTLANAYPTTLLRLDVEAQRADLVVVGRIVEVHQLTFPSSVGPVVEETRELNTEAVIGVVAVLKGASEGTIRVQYPVVMPPGGSIGLDGIPSGTTQLLFLKILSPSIYGLVDPHHASLPALPTFVPQAENVLDSASRVLCQVVDDRSGDLTDRLIAMVGLREIASPCIIPSLEAVTTDREPPEIHFTAIADLLRRNVTTHLSEAVAALQVDRDTHDLYRLQDNLGWAIKFGVSDPAATPYLALLMKSENEDNRIAAVSALARIKSPAAIALLEQGLSDHNLIVRYCSLVSIGEFYMFPDLQPSQPEFEEHEDTYQARWKQHSALSKN